jgi:hypothetical protein
MRLLVRGHDIEYVLSAVPLHRKAQHDAHFQLDEASVAALESRKTVTSFFNTVLLHAVFRDPCHISVGMEDPFEVLLC